MAGGHLLTLCQHQNPVYNFQTLSYIWNSIPEREAHLMEVAEITDKLMRGESASDEELGILLTAEGDDRETIFEAARTVRDRVFGKKTYLSSFMYFSTYCRNDCTFCYFRKSNNIERYRKDTDEVVKLSNMMMDHGINIVDLTMGEDPVMIRNDYQGITDIVRSIRETSDIPIMVSPGAVPHETFHKFADAGADIVAVYQETYNRRLFAERRLAQDFDYRRNQKIWAMEAGMMAEDGMMVGIGEILADRIDTIRNMLKLDCDQVRAMTFVPQEGTPMEESGTVSTVNELLAMAVMRLLKHDVMIPATLDVEGVAGMVTRLNAGASLITSIIPPHEELAGVAQSCMDIEDGTRNVTHVMEILDDMGRRPATPAEGRRMFDCRRARVRAMRLEEP